MAIIGAQFPTEFADARVVLKNVPCASSVYIGAAVRMSGGTAINAIADSLINSNIIGIVESKPSINQCNIRVAGLTEGNIFSGLDETREYFLSDSLAGGLTTTPPSASGSILLRVGQPYDSQTLLCIKGQRVVRS